MTVCIRINNLYHALSVNFTNQQQIFARRAQTVKSMNRPGSVPLFTNEWRQFDTAPLTKKIAKSEKLRKVLNS